MSEADSDSESDAAGRRGEGGELRHATAQRRRAFLRDIKSGGCAVLGAPFEVPADALLQPVNGDRIAAAVMKFVAKERE